MIFFSGRSDAARQLGKILPLERMKHEEWHLAAVSAGGLELASELNRDLNLPIDLFFSEGIYAPQNSECEIARVGETEEIVTNDALINAFEIEYDYIYGEASRKHEDKILSCIYRYRKGRHFNAVGSETILLIDEGAENGFKLMCAMKTVLSMNPKAVYVATAVMSLEVYEALESLTDGIFSLHVLDDYIDTPFYYSSLEPISDEKIEMILGD